MCILPDCASTLQLYNFHSGCGGVALLIKFRSFAAVIRFKSGYWQVLSSKFTQIVGTASTVLSSGKTTTENVFSIIFNKNSKQFKTMTECRVQDRRHDVKFSHQILASGRS